MWDSINSQSRSIACCSKKKKILKSTDFTATEIAIYGLSENPSIKELKGMLYLSSLAQSDLEASNFDLSVQSDICLWLK